VKLWTGFSWIRVWPSETPDNRIKVRNFLASWATLNLLRNSVFHDVI
jgi:hypothetical protein